MTKVKKIINNKHWGMWSKGYFNLAKQGLLYFKNKRKIGKVKHFKDRPKELFELEDGMMLIASIWNIKHGIELLIKWLGIKIDKGYLKDHDLNSLLNDLEKKINGCCVKTDLNKLKKIIEKYYKNQYSKITTPIDYENTFFKYPETQSKKSIYSLDYSSVHDFTRKDINKFLKDIDNLSHLHDRLEGQSRTFESHKKWGLGKKETEKILRENYKRRDKK